MVGEWVLVFPIFAPTLGRRLGRFLIYLAVVYVQFALVPGSTFGEVLLREAGAYLVWVAEFMEVALLLVGDLFRVGDDTATRPVLGGIVLDPIAWCDERLVLRYATVGPYFDEQAASHVAGRSCERFRTVLRRFTGVVNRDEG